jgi:C_GCAxxG_C_C family probable redox protein
MTDPIKIAEDTFARGFNCSQAVFSAYSSQFGISAEAALKLSSPFGGGIGRQGQVCGALIGALMVLGLRFGNAIPEGKENTYQIAEDVVRKFKDRHGTILCRELIGADISNRAGLQAAREGNLFAICSTLVRETAESLVELSIK